MGVIDDLRREIARALEEARQETLSASPAPPPPVRSGSGRLERQSLERTAPTSGPGLIKERDSAPAGLFELDFDLGVPAPPLIPIRENRPASPMQAEAPPPASAPTLTLTQQDIIRAIMLGEAIDEPKGRRSRRPHPR